MATAMANRPLSLFQRLRPLALALLATVTFGTAGYMAIEGARFFDALYMTAITISTVGYSEHVPLGTAGRVLTMGLLLVGVGLLFYGVTVASEFLFSSADHFRRRQLMRTIDQLHGHVIVCGYGRVGQFAARSLRDSGRPCLVIEQDPVVAERAEADGFLAIAGDATVDDTLRQVHVDTARGLLVCTGSDADNVFITLSARTLNPALEVVSRASSPANVEKMRRAGAKQVVSPYQAGGLHMANALVRPNLVNFLQVVTLSSGVELWMDEVVLGPSSSLAGRTLNEADLAGKIGVTLVALQRANQVMTPSGETRLEPGDSLVALGTREQLQALEQTAAG